MDIEKRSDLSLSAWFHSCKLSRQQSIKSLDWLPPVSAVRFAGRQSPDNRFVPKWQHWGVVDVRTLLRWKETLLSAVHFRKHCTCIATSHGGLVFLTKPLLHAQSCSLPIGRVLFVSHNCYRSKSHGWKSVHFSWQFHNMPPTPKISWRKLIHLVDSRIQLTHFGEGLQGNRGNLTWN